SARRGDPRAESERVLRRFPGVALTVALVDARHRRWIVATVVLTAAATAVYVPYHRLALPGPRGSSPVGLAFGVAAAAIMVFEAALNLRKRLPTWSMGHAETWLKGHVWLGLLTVPLV